LDQDLDHELDYSHCEVAVDLAEDLRETPELDSLFSECREMANSYRTQGSGKSRPRWTTIRIPLTAASAALVLLGATALLIGPVPTRYVTSVGEQRTLIADDDSLIKLNTETELRIEYDRDFRRIWLERGQAFFSVTPDAGRPFEVIARDGIVRAIGTSFDVSIHNGVGEVTVTVLEGSVEVVPRSGESSAHPEFGVPSRVFNGQSVTYWDNGAIAQVSQADVDALTAWREGRVDFDNQRLIDALAEHNRYTSRKIVVGDDALKDLRISGVIRIGDTDGLLFLLKESLGLTTVQQANVIVLLPNRKSREADSDPIVDILDRG
jgi:transmembrane sensor